MENYIWLCVGLCGFFFFSLYLELRLHPRPDVVPGNRAIYADSPFLPPTRLFSVLPAWVLRFPLLPAFVGLLCTPSAVRSNGGLWPGLVLAPVSAFFRTP